MRAYKITTITRCPECRQPCNGMSCKCGWNNKKFIRGKSKRIIPTCRLCNQPGTHNGICKMHFELAAEQESIKRIESYRVPGKNDLEIDVLTGKTVVTMNAGEIVE